MPGRFALIVASAEYDDVRFRRLRAPAVDAHDLTEVLRDARIGGYTVTEMINSPTPSISEEIEGFFKGRLPEDLLLLYFACHGVKDDRGHLYFAAKSTKLDRLASTGVSAVFVADQMYQSRARQIVLILDCCYSGAFTRGIIHRAGEKINLDTFAGRGRAVLFSSSAMEYAFELDSGELDGTGAVSLFTRTIVQGLRTGAADRNGDGLISVEELYDHVLSQMSQLMPRQSPGKFVDTYGDIYIAQSIRETSDLHVLPQEIRAALSNPLAGVRKGIVEELEPLLAAEVQSMRFAAKQALHLLAMDDNSRVAVAAARALGLDDTGQPATSRPGFLRPVPDKGRHEPADLKRSPAVSRSAEDALSRVTLLTDEAMAQRVEQISFSTTRLRPGYDEEEVDLFLDQIQDTFRGTRNPPLTPMDIKKKLFSTTRIRPGYDEEEVDKFLDEVEIRLAKLPLSES